MQLPNSLRAFRHRDYRLYFFGQGTSQIGTWLQLIATSWLVYRLSGSAFLLGLASFALQIPFLVLAPFGGVLVDRLVKRRVLYATQGIALAQSLVMFALVATGHVQPWHLVAGNLVLGIVNAFDSPARQSFLVELVGGREDLPNAIAMSSALMNGARFIGPMIGGVVIASAGVVWGFGLNSLSYLAMLGALAAMRAHTPLAAPGAESWARELLAGFRYTFGFLPTLSALLLGAFRDGVPRRAPVGARAAAAAAALGGARRAVARLLCLRARPLARAAARVPHRHGHHADRRSDQHRAPDDRRGPAARARCVALHHVFPRREPAWRAARRHRLALPRTAAHARARRAVRGARRRLLRLEDAGDPPGDPAALPAARHSRAAAASVAAHHQANCSHSFGSSAAISSRPKKRSARARRAASRAAASPPKQKMGTLSIISPRICAIASSAPAASRSTSTKRCSSTSWNSPTSPISRARLSCQDSGSACSRRPASTSSPLSSTSLRARRVATLVTA